MAEVYTSDVQPLPGIDYTNLPEDPKELRAKLYKLAQNQVANEQDLLKSQKDRLQKLEAQGRQVDLAPVLAWWDKSQGTNLLGGYRRPESELDREQRLGGLQDKIGRQQDQLAENQKNILALALKEKQGDQELLAKKAQQQKERVLPGSHVENFGTAESAFSALDDARKLTNETYKDIVGPTTGLGSKLAATFEFGDRGVRAKELDAALSARAQTIGKYLEGGKMTDQDITRYKAMLPTITDSPAVADSKVQNLQRLLAQKQNAELSNFENAGYDVGKIRRLQAPGLSKGPAVGFVKNGYQFIGGDPSKQENWKKVK